MLEQTYGAKPATAALASLVPGLQKGLVGQKVGSRVLVVVPPAEGYPQGNATPKVDPGDTLVFVVDVLFTSASELTSADVAGVEGHVTAVHPGDGVDRHAGGLGVLRPRLNVQPLRTTSASPGSTSDAGALLRRVEVGRGDRVRRRQPPARAPDRAGPLA